MPVVINEFEVVPAQPAPNQTAAPNANQPEPPPAQPSDYETQKMLERRHERAARTRAQ